jgi:hypothetical protein
MRKEIISLLAIIAFLILVYNIFEPTHLHTRHELQYCGGCHPEYSTIPEHKFADPLEKECIECHPDAAGGLSVHAEMIPSECDRCHVYGDKPAYSDCDLCHSRHSHIKGGIETGDQPCVNCHVNHSTLTDDACSKCHVEEYNSLKTQGGNHSELPESCYTCHIEHKYMSTCFDAGCHVQNYHNEMLLTNCTQCHEPHMPKDLSFSSDITPEECSVCHLDEVRYFQEHPSNHSGLDCVDCHQKHQKVKQCIDCHADVHPQLTELEAEKCMVCHGDPHSPSKYGL